MNSTAVSVIIPVYNAEQYIEKCLDSIFEQSIEDIEIICVDDGSSDGTMDILKRMQQQDDRLKIIEYGSNKGQAYARNRGLEAATGEYIYFLDADDTLIDKDALKVLLETAVSENLDCVTFESEAVPEGSGSGREAEENLAKHAAYEGVYDGESYLTRTLENMDFKPAVWMQFWNREFLEKQGLLFDEEISPCEDHLFTIQAFCRAGRIRHIDRKLHRYLCREGSSSRRSTVQLYRANVLCCHRGIEFCRNENVRPETLKAVTEYSRLLKNLIINVGADLVMQGEEIGHITDFIPRKTLSVCMIVKDEERSIEKALKSVVSFADEVIVVDTGSTDRTVDIASGYTGCVYLHPWQEHFGDMRNISYSHAGCDYVMYFDADYEIDERNAEKINRLKEILTDEKSVCVEYHSSEQKLPVALHMITLRDDRKWEGAVHERIPLREPVLYTDILVRHSDKREQHFERNVKLFSKISEREFNENYWLVAQCYSDSVMAGNDEWAERFRSMSKSGDYSFLDKLSPSVVAGHVLMHYEKYDEALKWFEDYLEESGRWIDEKAALRDKDISIPRVLFYDEKANGYAIKCSARAGDMEKAKALNERLGRYHKDSYIYAMNRLWLMNVQDRDQMKN